MFANAMNMRIGAMVAGLIVLGGYLLMGGHLGFGHHGVIQIEFGAYADEFLGSEVEIDGQVAGKLKRFHNAWRTGFEVKEGRHAVRIRHPEFESVTRVVDARSGPAPVLLVLDLQSAVDPNGQWVTQVTFQ